MAKVLGIRFSDAEHAALARAAEADQRSMSALARKVVVHWLRTNGFEPTAKAATSRRATPRVKRKAAPASLHAARRAAA